MRRLKSFFSKAALCCLILVFLVCYQNCSQFVSDSDEISSVSSLSSVKCDPTDPRNPQKTELKRLNANELRNTIEDLFKTSLTTTDLDSLLARLDPLIAALPKDNGLHHGMNLTDQSVTVDHLDYYLKISQSITDFLSASEGRIGALVGSCYAINKEDINCKTQFLKKFGLKALRRPPSEEDITFYLQLMNDSSKAYVDAVIALLNSPFFIYHIETGLEKTKMSTVQGDVVLLDPYERASKLSYFIQQTLPDDELFKSAESGEIMTDLGLKKEIKRLLGKTETRKRLSQFFANQWLDLDETPLARTDIPSIKTLFDEFNTSVDLVKNRNNLIQEVYDYFDYIIWEQKGSYKDLMTSDLVFPRTADLAEIYNTPIWNGKTDLLSLVRAPATERAGVLTRAQNLFTGERSTRSIIRGVRTFERYLCGDLTLPDDNSNPEGVVIHDDMSEREYVIAITEIPGTSCVSCHSSVINPIGFTFESFDQFGRFRADEKIFHPEESAQKGTLLTSKPVNSKTKIDLPNMISGEMNSAIDLAQNLASSSHSNACFSSHLWNFALKNYATMDANGCAVASIYTALTQQEGSILKAIEQIPLEPEFFRRTSK